MVIIQGLLALIARQASKLLNTAFGWATVLLFGKVPEDRQIYLSGITLGSVAWLVVLLGLIFPAVATFLLAFIPLPDWVDEIWIRLVMLAAAILIPLIVGIISLQLLDPEDRPHGAGATIKTALKGYPYTLGLAITLIMMTVFAPILKLIALSRRWTTTHTPVVVEPQDYLEVVGQIQQALKQVGWRTERQPASWMLRLPTKVLTLLAGGAVETLVADKLTTLRAKTLEVVLHPSDLVIMGTEEDAAHARAILTEQLAFSKAYMTWTKEANELEDRLTTLWSKSETRSDRFVPREAMARLQTIERDLKAMKISYQEWEVLFRELLVIERAVLQAMAGTVPTPEAAQERVIELGKREGSKPVANRRTEESQGARQDQGVGVTIDGGAQERYRATDGGSPPQAGVPDHQQSLRGLATAGLISAVLSRVQRRIKRSRGSHS